MEYKDAFGNELSVGDKVIFHSYDSLAKGTIIGLSTKKMYRAMPEVIIEKEEGPSYTYMKEDKIHPSRMTRLDKIAKL